MTPADHPAPTEPPAPPAHRLRYVARTDRGLLRATNQDSVFAGDRLLVVADGMGGHAAGDTASRLAVDAFTPLNALPPGPDLLHRVLSAVRAGNASIKAMVDAHPELEGMGTTVTAMLFDGRRAALAHVGDSRAYLYREGVLHQLTHDDTFVQSLVDDGRITEHQAHAHPQRNLLLRALTGLELDPMLVERETKPGDRYMLCSDGLCGVVDPESIADALSHPDPEVAADTLIQLALVAGGPDNVTTIVADVLSTGETGTADGAATAPIATLATDSDPASTNPINRLTREMPRVPLPPIPEEPAAPADVIDDDYDDYDEPAGAGADDEAPSDAADSETSSAATDLAGGDDAAGRGEEKPGGDATGARRSRTPESEARRHWYRRGAVIVAALVLLGAAITGATIWVRHQYYVSEQGNVVVVFRGVNGSLLGWGFSTFEETSCAGATDCTPMKVSDLQPGARNQVRAGIKATSLASARTVVQRLSAQLLPPCPDPLDSRDGHDDEPSRSTEPTGGATSPGSTEASTAGTTAAATSTARTSAADAPRTTGTHSTATTTTETPVISASPADTVAATPLAPATQTPGVTCRTVS